jgi:hypothetical protein
MFDTFVLQVSFYASLNETITNAIKVLKERRFSEFERNISLRAFMSKPTVVVFTGTSNTGSLITIRATLIFSLGVFRHSKKKSHFELHITWHIITSHFSFFKNQLSMFYFYFIFVFSFNCISSRLMPPLCFSNTLCIPSFSERLFST